MSVPNNLKYSKDHEWVQINDNIATVGITLHAAESLGDIVYVDAVSYTHLTLPTILLV